MLIVSAVAVRASARKAVFDYRSDESGIVPMHTELLAGVDSTVEADSTAAEVSELRIEDICNIARNLMINIEADSA